MAKRVFTQTFGVVGAIIERDGKILLVKENSGFDDGKWNQPAGWPDVGEDLVQAVSREVKEETGLDFTPTGIIGIYSLHRSDLKEKMGETPHAIKIIFRGKVKGDLNPDLEEVREAKFFTLEEIEGMGVDTLRDLDIKAEVRDYFAGKNYPLDIIHHTVSKNNK